MVLYNFLSIIFLDFKAKSKTINKILIYRKPLLYHLLNYILSNVLKITK